MLRTKFMLHIYRIYSNCTPGVLFRSNNFQLRGGGIKRGIITDYGDAGLSTHGRDFPDECHSTCMDDNRGPQLRL